MFANVEKTYKLLADCAQMAQNIYTDDLLQDLRIRKWETPAGGVYDNPSNGLKIACYVHHDYEDGTKRAVIVFRGTANFENLKTDLELMFGQIPSNFCAAVSAVNAMISRLDAGYRLSFTGHSLGAVYAALFAHLKRTAAIAFDSPGVIPLIEIDPTLLEASRDPRVKILNYLSAPHVINTLHPHSGPCFRVQVGFRKFEITNGHVMRSLAGTGLQLLNTASAVIPVAGEAIIAARGAAAVPSVVRGATAALSTVAKMSASSGGTLIRRLVSHTVGTADYLVWLLRQHSMSHIATEITGTKARLKLATISAWPRLTLAFPTVLSVGALQSEIPLHPDSEGVHTLFDELRFLEMRLGKYYGDSYRVEFHEGEEAYRRQLDHYRDFGRETEVSERPLPIMEYYSADHPLIRSITRYSLESQSRIQAVLNESAGNFTMYPTDYHQTALIPVTEQQISVRMEERQTALTTTGSTAIILSPSAGAGAGAGAHPSFF